MIRGDFPLTSPRLRGGFFLCGGFLLFSQPKEPSGFLRKRYAFGLLNSVIDIVQLVVGALDYLQMKIGAGSGK